MYTSIRKHITEVVGKYYGKSLFDSGLKMADGDDSDEMIYQNSSSWTTIIKDILETQCSVNQY